MAKPRKTMAAKCPECGKTVRILPAGADWGNAVYPVLHRDSNGEYCEGVREEIHWPEWIEPTPKKQP